MYGFKHPHTGFAALCVAIILSASAAHAKTLTYTYTSAKVEKPIDDAWYDHYTRWNSGFGKTASVTFDIECVVEHGIVDCGSNLGGGFNILNPNNGNMTMTAVSGFALAGESAIRHSSFEIDSTGRMTSFRIQGDEWGEVGDFLLSSNGDEWKFYTIGDAPWDAWCITNARTPYDWSTGACHGGSIPEPVVFDSDFLTTIPLAPGAWVLETPISVPIPASLSLLAVGLGGLGLIARRRRTAVWPLRRAGQEW